MDRHEGYPPEPEDPFWVPSAAPGGTEVPFISSAWRTGADGVEVSMVRAAGGSR